MFRRLFRHFVLPKQLNLVPNFSRLTVQLSATLAAVLTSSVQHDKILPKFFQIWSTVAVVLVMMNYSCDFSQSETEKYFE